MRLLLTSILLLSFISLFGQTIKELEHRRKKTEQEIEFTSSLLQKTEKERAQSLNQLNLLKSQIDLRKRLVRDINKQLLLLEDDISDKTLIINQLNKDLANLKKEYAKLIRFARKNRSEMQVLVFIFAAEDFNQAYRRLRFYQQFIRFREKQAKDIVNTSRMIKIEVESLSANVKQLELLKIEKGNEVFTLNKEEIKYSQTVQQLRKKEAQLRKDIETRQKAMDALNKEIADLIAEEARKAAEAKKDVVRDARYLKLSDGFAGNKGKLPWPTDKGVIVGQFGEHDHPVLKGVKIRNNGVDISTIPGAKVKAIFEGEVKKIVSIPGNNVAVIVRHGDFLSVYSNLIKVNVKVGDIITATQVIGEVYTDMQTQKGFFNLQIWQESKILNPTTWILP